MSPRALSRCNCVINDLTFRGIINRASIFLACFRAKVLKVVVNTHCCTVPSPLEPRRTMHPLAFHDQGESFIPACGTDIDTTSRDAVATVMGGSLSLNPFSPSGTAPKKCNSMPPWQITFLACYTCARKITQSHIT
ncbi:Uncharacterized protein HZ326_16151 [Fusarium oxysporum f. sp. albedinis]|nr:Uncharacterized protein HZ326_16151 [Fusarium oxysporum f. sp. albedinis]